MISPIVAASGIGLVAGTSPPDGVVVVEDESPDDTPVWIGVGAIVVLLKPSRRDSTVSRLVKVDEEGLPAKLKVPRAGKTARHVER